MHVLFDLGHPAHVHLFRHTAMKLLKRGDQVTITIRDRGIISKLLEYYGLPYVIASKPRHGILGNGLELIIHNWKTLMASLPNRPDFLVGTSVSAAHVGFIVNRPSIIFNEDDADYIPLFTKITYPFATRIVIPDTLRDRHSPKTIRHNSLHELAYLHPDHFTPNPDALSHLGVKKGEPFFIIRMVDLIAHHDANEKGLSVDEIEALVEDLDQYGQVFVNAEGKIPFSLKERAFQAPPTQMHDILAFTKMLISDSQTMTIEAAVLGRPAIRCNSFVGRCSVISELETRYGLAWGFQPSEFKAMQKTIHALINSTDLEEIMAARRAYLLSEKHDLSNWMIKQFDKGFQ